MTLGFSALVTLAFCFFATALCVKFLLPKFSHLSQPIYEEGPAWHAKKRGTPTMGGIAFLFVGVLSSVLGGIFLFVSGEREEGLSFLSMTGYAVLNGAVGIYDDVLKLKHRQNRGLTPRGKLVLQFLAAALFLAFHGIFLEDGTAFHFGNAFLDLGVFYYPAAAVIAVGVVNFANLTDGIDGLASCVAFGIGIFFYAVGAVRGEALARVGGILVGTSLGFLLYNLHPAKIFMGDTGSLYLGGLCAAGAFLLGNPLSAAAYGGVYVIEGASVILQVLVFRLTKNRLFPMTPIHHTLEKRGFSENRICILALILTLLFSLPLLWWYLR